MREEREIKVHLLPNLMTAGNLFCGFMAVLIIFDGHKRGGMAAIDETARMYKHAILLIFGACIFDLLDGRLARISGQESAFGREFDSIADIISFGLAPALLLMDIVLFSSETWRNCSPSSSCCAGRCAWRVSIAWPRAAMIKGSRNFGAFPSQRQPGSSLH